MSRTVYSIIVQWLGNNNLFSISCSDVEAHIYTTVAMVTGVMQSFSNGKKHSWISELI